MFRNFHQRHQKVHPRVLNITDKFHNVVRNNMSENYMRIFFMKTKINSDKRKKIVENLIVCCKNKRNKCFEKWFSNVQHIRKKELLNKNILRKFFKRILINRIFKVASAMKFIKHLPLKKNTKLLKKGVIFEMKLVNFVDRTLKRSF